MRSFSRETFWEDGSFAYEKGKSAGEWHRDFKNRINQALMFTVYF